MPNIVPTKKRKLSLAEKYRWHLRATPEETDRLHNKNNIFDDSNRADKAMLKDAKLFSR